MHEDVKAQGIYDELIRPEFNDELSVAENIVVANYDAVSGADQYERWLGSEIRKQYVYPGVAL